MIIYKCKCNQFVNISLYDETTVNNRLIEPNRTHTLYIYTYYTSIDFVWCLGISLYSPWFYLVRIKCDDALSVKKECKNALELP